MNIGDLMARKKKPKPKKPKPYDGYVTWISMGTVWARAPRVRPAG